MASTVFFTRDLSAAALVRLYDALNIELQGKVAVKLHSGEKGNQNFLKPDFFRPIIEKVHGTVVECNTAYDGARDTTVKHLKLLAEHGWSTLYPTDLMDAEGPDLVLPVKGESLLKENLVGKNLKNYDSLLVLSHFKGHPMGGFGGALKQLSIGCASSEGKRRIHGAGDPSVGFFEADHVGFIKCMAEAASTVVDMFKGRCAFISAMKNLSVDCDCCAVAEDPCMQDIGILASLDPVSIDQSCIDKIYASKDQGRAHFVERVESRQGLIILEHAAEMGYGSREYELKEI